jgi:hypothetical protein
VDPSRLLFVVILPGVISLVVHALAWTRLSRRGDGELRGEWAGPLGVGAAMLAAMPLVMGRMPPLTPKLAEEWVFHLTALAMVLGLAGYGLARWLGGGSPRQRLLVVRGGAVVSGLAPAAVTLVMLATIARSMYEHQWTTTGTRLMWLVPLAVAGTVLIFANGQLASRRRGVLLPLMWWLCATGLSLTIVQAGSAKLGELAAVLAAGLGGAWFTAIWRRDLRLGFGGGLTAMTVYTSILLAAYFYTELTGIAAVLLAIAPAAAWGLQWAGEAATRKRRATVIGLVVLAQVICLGLAAGLARPPVVESEDDIDYSDWASAMD